METTFVNTTPHAITEMITDGLDSVKITHNPSGFQSRVQTPDDLDIFHQDHIVYDSESEPFFGVRTLFTRNPSPGVVIGLPEPVEGTLYIVSGQVLAALAGIRSDVVAPATDPRHQPERNEKGHIVAVRGFVRNP